MTSELRIGAPEIVEGLIIYFQDFYFAKVNY